MENITAKTIITDLDELCKEECVVINPKTEGTLLREITLALKNTMRENKLNYLAAPQIGYFRRVFCMRDGIDNFKTFVNPMITKTMDKTIARDACASLPNKEYLIYRNNKVKLAFITPMGELVECNLEREKAWCAQQCIELLDGITLENYGMKIIDKDDPELGETWDSLSDEEHDEIRQLYIDSIDGEYKKLEDEAKDDTDISQMRDGIKFITSVFNGETKLENIEIPTTNDSEKTVVSEATTKDVKKSVRKKKPATEQAS